MGLEIPEEFWPITPIRIISLPKTTTSTTPLTTSKNSSDEETSVEEEIKNVCGGDEEEDCHTPKCADQILKTPLVCPPAPRKPRPTKRKSSVQTQIFFHVPRDLTSVFTPIKKIRAA